MLGYAHYVFHQLFRFFENAMIYSLQNIALFLTVILGKVDYKGVVYMPVSITFGLLVLAVKLKFFSYFSTLNSFLFIVTQSIIYLDISPV